jgi:hypothetical protein
LYRIHIKVEKSSLNLLKVFWGISTTEFAEVEIE